MLRRGRGRTSARCAVGFGGGRGEAPNPACRRGARASEADGVSECVSWGTRGTYHWSRPHGRHRRCVPLETSSRRHMRRHRLLRRVMRRVMRWNAPRRALTLDTSISRPPQHSVRHARLTVMLGITLLTSTSSASSIFDNSPSPISVSARSAPATRDRALADLDGVVRCEPRPANARSGSAFGVCMTDGSTELYKNACQHRDTSEEGWHSRW